MKILKRKAYQYRYGDKKKKLKYVNEEKGITYKEIEQMINENGKDCYYCENETYIIDLNRSKSQLTMERLDNSKGHSVSNCVIACLGCNTKRGDMCSSDEFKLAVQARKKGNKKIMNQLIKKYYSLTPCPSAPPTGLAPRGADA